MKSKPTILITGCSSGIGLCCAQGLSAQGWHVFATVRRKEDALHLPNCDVIFLEQTDSASVQACATEVLRLTNGKLDAVFCNIGMAIPGAVEDLSRNALLLQFETNVFGTIELINALLPAMRNQEHGKIIINSSILGFAAMPYRGAYNASKYALEGFADTLRQELHGSNIYVSLIEPGPIKSRFRANAQVQFSHWVNPHTSFHRDAYIAMAERLAKPGPVNPFTLQPDAVLDDIFRILRSPRPSARYQQTMPSKLFWYLRRLLPTRWFDHISRMGSGDEPGFAYKRKEIDTVGPRP